jgi:hypothetical protein
MIIEIDFDAESDRWFVKRSSIEGLRLEGRDPFELLHRIADAAPELMALNGQLPAR